jgi:hypothetical protein
MKNTTTLTSAEFLGRLYERGSIFPVGEPPLIITGETRINWSKITPPKRDWRGEEAGELAARRFMNITFADEVIMTGARVVTHLKIWSCYFRKSLHIGQVYSSNGSSLFVRDCRFYRSLNVWKSLLGALEISQSVIMHTLDLSSLSFRDRINIKKVLRENLRLNNRLPELQDPDGQLRMWDIVPQESWQRRGDVCLIGR